MAEKTDYSPVVEEAGDAEKRRERRKWGALLTGAHVFWIYGAILAGIILLVIYLTGGFGAGSDLANSLDASGSWGSARKGGKRAGPRQYFRGTARDREHAFAFRMTRRCQRLTERGRVFARLKVAVQSR